MARNYSHPLNVFLFLRRLLYDSDISYPSVGNFCCPTLPEPSGEILIDPLPFPGPSEEPLFDLLPFPGSLKIQNT